ncbi:MAG: M81 family metallopeptidase, partial [Proteobacteria bacterium]|nr:M81 family metallopeptidase [Pseudomonadota bacterium]
MRVVVAMMSHETNTFSPVPTPLESFGPGGPYFGAAAAAAYRGTNTPMAAYLDIFEGAGAEIATPVAADAHPSARVAAAAYQRITDAICAAVDEGCDALCLDLHGAMVAESTDDGEGTLLARLRAAHPELPIAVAFDLHANLTREIVDN